MAFFYHKSAINYDYLAILFTEELFTGEFYVNCQNQPCR